MPSLKPLNYGTPKSTYYVSSEMSFYLMEIRVTKLRLEEDLLSLFNDSMGQISGVQQM